jgi:hypothetical protein
MEERKTFVSAATKFWAMKATVSWPSVPQANVWWADERRRRDGVVSVSFMVANCDGFWNGGGFGRWNEMRAEACLSDEEG